MIFIVKLSFSSNYIIARSINVLSFFSLSPPLSSSLYLHLPPSLVPAGNSRPCRSESTSRGQGRGPHSWILRFWFWLRFWLSCHSPCASSPGRGKRRGRERRGTECRHWTPLIPSSSLSAEHSVLRSLFLSRSRSVSPPSPYCKTGSVAEQWSCLISIVEMVYPLGKKIKFLFFLSWPGETYLQNSCTRLFKKKSNMLSHACEYEILLPELRAPWTVDWLESITCRIWNTSFFYL